MNTFLHKLFVVICMLSAILNNKIAKAQCGGTYSPVTLNWDYQYYNNSDLPSSPINFMMGKNTLSMSWSGATFNGVNNNHTNHTNSYGDGNDIQFSLRNGSVTFTFLQPVENLRFTIHDVDNRHRVDPKGYNASNVQVPVVMTRVSGTAGSLVGSGGNNPYYYNSASYALNSTNSSVNISIAGPLSRVTLNFTKSTSGSDPVYISDIQACTNSTWATDYQAISAPETGQPTHMLVAYDSIMYVVNKLDNTAMQLFNDPSMTRLNTVAYDPYNQIIYYCNSARVSSNRSVYKYDVKTGTKSTFIADVNTLGIQTFAQGLATAGAGFYDGFLFLGTDSDLYDWTPAAIYRIDIDNSGTPIRASRYWGVNSAIPTGGGGTDILYDWGDFVINDGVLYNFNGGSDAAANTELEHFDLNAQSKLAGYSFSPDTMAQASLDYEGNIFSIRNGFYYQQYNMDGTFGARNYYSGILPTRVLCDGAESFKYPYDYGDAPSTYGYASHVFRVSPNLRIGSTIDYEMSSFYSLDASADNSDVSDDEDGVNPSYFTSNPLTASHTNYTVPITISNTSGANAYLYGYLDFNSDGSFTNIGERSGIITIPTGTINGSFNVTWSGLTGGSAGSSFIRFRLSNDSTELRYGSGYARSGEVEDYPINITPSFLPVELVSFTGEALENNTTLLKWSTASEFNNQYFEVQRQDANIWEMIGIENGKGNSQQLQNYTHIDTQPKEGINYYRLKQVDFDGKFEYSPVISVKFNNISNSPSTTPAVSIYPNPTSGEVWVKTDENIPSDNPQNISVFDVKGQQILSSLHKENTQLVDLKYFENGLYYLKIGKQSYKIIKH